MSVPDFQHVTNPEIPGADAMAASIEHGSYHEEKVFKDNRHNYAALVRLPYAEGTFVLKVPRARNSRLWQRLLSRFRSSESLRQFHSFRELAELGFDAPVPIAAGEQRRSGFVLRSYLLYRYCEGRPASTEDSLRVARELRRLHELGYTRRDPKADNFLIDGDRIIFIDFRLTQHQWMPFWHTTLEFAHALHTMPGAIEVLPTRVRRSLIFRLLYWYRLNLSRFKKGKRKLLGRDI